MTQNGEVGTLAARHNHIVQTPSHRRLHVELPSLLVAKVEHKVNGSLRSHVVTIYNLVVFRCLHIVNVIDRHHHTLWIAEQMAPAYSVQTNNFKRAGLTRITSEPVREVHRSQQRRIQEANKRVGSIIRFVREVGITLNGQTKHRSEPAADPQACIRVQTIHPLVAGSLGSQASVYANIEVIKRFALSHRLCLSTYCHHCDSKQNYEFFHIPIELINYTFTLIIE